MFRFLGLYAKYKFMFWVGEFFYYSINLGAVIYSWYLVGKKLAQMGYESRKLETYILLCVLLSLPAGFASSRAAGMFYYPSSQWSLNFLLESMLHGKTHTYHASLIFPVLLYFIYGFLFRIKPWHVLDTVFLYIPLGHAIARVSCLIVGCCWGHHVYINLFGLNLGFQNPTPLWESGLNLCIYYVVKRIHNNTYFNPATERNYSGNVMAAYLTLYGVNRFFMEIFRTEKIVFDGLTQAQVVMLIFISIGLCIFAYNHFFRKESDSTYVGSMYYDTKIGSGLGGIIMVTLLLLTVYYFYQIYAILRMAILWAPKIPFEQIQSTHIALLLILAVLFCTFYYVKYLKKEQANALLITSIHDAPPEPPQNLRSLVLLASYFSLTLFLLSIFYFLVMKMMVLPFPFQRVADFKTAYMQITTYLPLLILPLVSIIWLKKAEIPFFDKFKIQVNSKTITTFLAIGLAVAVSIGYSLDLLVLKEPRLRGLAFWPPVLILSLINAMTEEIAYRLTAYSLVLKAGFPRLTAVVSQALLYSSVHYFFNPTLGVLSLLYGLILGVVMDRTQSVTLCIICHFIIDLGAIGRPILAF